MKKGFSLIEMLISILVLAIGIMGVAQVFPLGMKSVFRSQMYTKAVEYGEQKIEELRTIDYSKLDSSPYDSGSELNNDGFLVVWSVSANGTPVPNSRFVTVDVYWAPNISSAFDPTNETADIEIHLESYIANVQW